jgi:hypothetical protein
MHNLDFISWMEALSAPPSYKPSNPSYSSLNRVKDFRMMHNGPFTGFKDPPQIARRFGGDLMTGMQRYAQHVKSDLTAQEPGATYDVGRELKYSVDERGKSLIITIPCSVKLFHHTDKDGNLLDKHGEITTDNPEYSTQREIKNKARKYLIQYLRTNEELLEELKQKNADLNSASYIEYHHIDAKDDDGNDMVDLVFAASIKDASEFSNTNSIYTPRRS